MTETQTPIEDRDDLRWLAARQPDTLEPSPLVTDRARSELLEHVQGASKRPVGRGFRRRVLALGGVALAAAAAGLLIGLPTGESGDVAKAEALTLLANRVAVAPAPPGDATLVLRTHMFPDDQGFTGADLYTDDGRYFFGATQGELRRAIAAGEETDDGTSGRVIRAIRGSAELTPGEARAKLLEAAPVPEASAPAAAAALKEKAAAAGEKLEPYEPPTPAEREAQVDNMLWTYAMDALTAGAGDSEIRAGAMLVLSTIPTVRTEQTTFDGSDVIEVHNTGFPDRYEEILILDASTGVLLHFRGGDIGEAPSVNVSYDVKRVEVSDLR